MSSGLLRVMARRTDPRAVRAAWWASRALSHARRALVRGEFDGVSLSRPPELPAGAGYAVEAVLRRRSASCLERSLVLQRWHAAHGRPLDVVIGVKAPASDFAAHAWLEGEPPPRNMTFGELMRLSP